MFWCSFMAASQSRGYLLGSPYTRDWSPPVLGNYLTCREVLAPNMLSCLVARYCNCLIDVRDEIPPTGLRLRDLIQVTLYIYTLSGNIT